MRCTSLLVLALAAFGCEEDGKPTHVNAVPASASPTTVATPTDAPAARSASATATAAAKATAEAAASVSASASASASAASSAALPPAEGLLANIVKAEEVKVSRMESTGSALIEEAEEVRELLEAIGMTQKPVAACPRGLPALTLRFNDRFGTRLGMVGLYTEEDGSYRDEAVVNDALGDACQGIELEDAAALRKRIDEALPAAE